MRSVVFVAVAVLGVAACHVRLVTAAGGGCSADFEVCSADKYCCSNKCIRGKCARTGCSWGGEACDDNSHCCSHYCQTKQPRVCTDDGGGCTAGGGSYSECSNNSQCCSGNCPANRHCTRAGFKTTGCQPHGFGCGSCCADGVRGALWIDGNCAQSCQKQCGATPCGFAAKKPTTAAATAAGVTIAEADARHVLTRHLRLLSGLIEYVSGIDATVTATAAGGLDRSPDVVSAVFQGIADEQGDLYTAIAADAEVVARLTAEFKASPVYARAISLFEPYGIRSVDGDESATAAAAAAAARPLHATGPPQRAYLLGFGISHRRCCANNVGNGVAFGGPADCHHGMAVISESCPYCEWCSWASSRNTAAEHTEL